MLKKSVSSIFFLFGFFVLLTGAWGFDEINPEDCSNIETVFEIGTMDDIKECYSMVLKNNQTLLNQISSDDTSTSSTTTLKKSSTSFGTNSVKSSNFIIREGMTTDM